jgi:hypothetical protein
MLLQKPLKVLEAIEEVPKELVPELIAVKPVKPSLLFRRHSRFRLRCFADPRTEPVLEKPAEIHNQSVVCAKTASPRTRWSFPPLWFWARFWHDPRFALGQIRKITLNAGSDGIDWSKLWPEVHSWDKGCTPYEMVVCLTGAASVL